MAFCTGSKLTQGSVSDTLCDFLNSGTLESLLHLNLAGLHLEDSDLYQIVSSLKRAKQMLTLNLSQNFKLTWLAFKLILQNVNVHTLTIEGCYDILSDYDENFFDFHEVLCKNVEISLPCLNKTQTNDYNLKVNKLKDNWSSLNASTGKVVMLSTNKMLLTFDDEPDS